MLLSGLRLLEIFIAGLDIGVVLWFFIAMARVIDLYMDSRYVCHNMARKTLNAVGWM